MTYKRRTWVDDDGSLTVGTLFDAEKMNNIEAGIGDRPESRHDAISKPTAGTGNLTWTHTPVSAYVAGVVVGVVQNYRSKLAFGVTKVTYGGTEMLRLALQEETGKASQAWYWLPTAQIPQGANEVVVTAANAEAKRQAFCATVTADNPIRPVFRNLAGEAATLATAEINNSLQTGAFYGMLSVTKQPTVRAASKGEAPFATENLGSGGTELWVAVQNGKESNQGKGTGTEQRPSASWEMASAAYGATMVMFGRIQNFGIVTALPGLRAGPGDRCEFVPAEGMLWELVYDGEGEFPWKKVGGPPLTAKSEGQNVTKNEWLTAGQAAITTPNVKMIAIVQFGANAGSTSGNNNQLRQAIFKGSVEVSGETAIAVYPSANINGPMHGQFDSLEIPASTSVNLRYKTESALAGTFYQQHLEIDPIRVG